MLLAKRDMEALNLENLPAEKLDKLMKLKEDINLYDISLLNYGDSVSQNIDASSLSLLNQTKISQSPETMDLLLELNENMGQLDAAALAKKSPNFLQKLFKSSKVDVLIKKQDTILPLVESTKSKLQEAQNQLTKDIESCRMQYNDKMHSIEEMDYYILAGKLKLKESESEWEDMKANTDPEDALAVEEAENFKGNMSLLQRKVDNLILLRELAIQDLKKIKVLTEADIANINNIETSIKTTIPAWESQLVIAILINRAKVASDMQNSITDITNKLIEQNAEYLATTAINIKKSVERGVIDYEALKASDKKMEEMTVNLIKIGEEATAKRQAAIAALEDSRVKRNNLIGILGTNGSDTKKLEARQ